jgi:hypothetical protein
VGGKVAVIMVVVVVVVVVVVMVVVVVVVVVEVTAAVIVVVVVVKKKRPSECDARSSKATRTVDAYHHRCSKSKIKQKKRACRDRVRVKKLTGGTWTACRAHGRGCTARHRACASLRQTNDR